MEIDTSFINFLTVQGMVYKPKYVTFMSESFLTLMRLIFVIDMSKSHSTTLTSLLAVGNYFYYTLFLQCSMPQERDLLAAKRILGK